MPTGSIRFYNQKEGYGFVERDHPGTDVFVHKRDVEAGEIAEGCRVRFEIEPSERGPRAMEVEVISEASP